MHCTHWSSNHHYSKREENQLSLSSWNHLYATTQLPPIKQKQNKQTLSTKSSQLGTIFSQTVPKPKHYQGSTLPLSSYNLG